MRAGDRLPTWELPITPTLVVSTAIATRDFQDVHHDRDLAQSYGSKDIFLNILTTNGLVGRYVTDSLGQDLDVLSIAIRLGAPAHPYDTLRFSGEVESVEDDQVVVAVRGAVVSTGSTTGAGSTIGAGSTSEADHVSGRVALRQAQDRSVSG